MDSSARIPAVDLAGAYLQLSSAIINAHGTALPANWAFVDPITTIDLLVAEITTLRVELGWVKAEASAAPGLLAALKEVVALSDRDTDVWKRAKAAIARAEGRDA